MLDFLITGTRVYGPVSENSDLDIVVKAADIVGVLDSLEKHNIPIYKTDAQEDYGEGSGFYFDFIGITFNIIQANDDDSFGLWKKRTEAMKKLNSIENRGLRYAAFNACCTDGPDFEHVSCNN